MKLFDEMDLKKSIDIVLTRRRMEKEGVGRNPGEAQKDSEKLRFLSGSLSGPQSHSKPSNYNFISSVLYIFSSFSSASAVVFRTLILEYCLSFDSTTIHLAFVVLVFWSISSAAIL